MNYQDIIRNPLLRPGLLLVAERCLTAMASSKQNTYSLTFNIDCFYFRGGIERAANNLFQTLQPFCGNLIIKEGKGSLNGSSSFLECTMQDSAEAIRNNECKIPCFIEILEQAKIISAVSKKLFHANMRVYKSEKPMVMDGKYFKLSMPFNSIEPPLFLSQTLSLHTPMKFEVSDVNFNPACLDEDDLWHNIVTYRLDKLGIAARAYFGTGSNDAIKLTITDPLSQKQMADLCRDYRQMTNYRGK